MFYSNQDSAAIFDNSHSKQDWQSLKRLTSHCKIQLQKGKKYLKRQDIHIHDNVQTNVYIQW